jgi:hypothetical protein
MFYKFKEKIVSLFSKSAKNISNFSHLVCCTKNVVIFFSIGHSYPIKMCIFAK